MEQSNNESLESFNQKVRQNLINARKANHLSQEQMADMLFMSRQNYSHLETGASEIKQNQFFRIATILHIAPCSLLFTHEPPKDEYYFQCLLALQQIAAMLEMPIDKL